MDEARDHLKPSELVKDPDGFCLRFREASRLAPVAFCIDSELDPADFKVICRVAKQLKVAQITLAASKLGTPFNSEIDRLRDYLKIGSEDAIRVSIKTKTGHLTEDPNTAIELCQAAPGVGLTLDPSYFICGPHRNGNFDQVYPYVFHVHLRDTTTDSLQVPMGLGQVDYNRITSQLERVKYHGALSVEVLPELLEPEARLMELRKLHRYLDSLL
jgi:sugar phosphate isomerase/epimerase